jgi:hypothetical protein
MTACDDPYPCTLLFPVLFFCPSTLLSSIHVLLGQGEGACMQIGSIHIRTQLSIHQSINLSNDDRWDSSRETVEILRGEMGEEKEKEREQEEEKEKEKLELKLGRVGLSLG